jgi:hypothetical protein
MFTRSRMLRIPVDECNTGGEGFKQAISPESKYSITDEVE